MQSTGFESRRGGHTHEGALTMSNYVESPRRVIRILRNLAAEFRKSGRQTIDIDEFEAAIDLVEQNLKPGQ
jgi:hypothetical protein